MACYNPLRAWQTLEGDIHFYARGTSGKKGARAPNYRRELTLPCGRCIGCRVEKSKQWAIRIMHEAQMHEANSFLTLTYENLDTRSGASDDAGSERLILERADRYTAQMLKDERRQAPGTLNYKHFQKFMKDLRQHLTRKKKDTKVRFYMCGEYGDNFGRPHYHAALFGVDFADDRRIHSEAQSGTLYTSPTLDKLWPHGYAVIGALTFESAQYVASYVTKKITGSKAADHYQRVDVTTGETYWVEPEFSVMSRKPGIGKPWLDKFARDIYEYDTVHLRGKKLKPPRMYDIWAETNPLLNHLDLSIIKEERTNKIAHADNTPERLATREAVALARAQFKKRNLK